MRYALIALCCVVLAGCVTAPPAPTRSEWEAVHLRTFPGKTQREVLDAAEKVLRAADGDFTFDFPADKLMASRRWTVYAVLVITGGTDYWTIETREVEGGTQASVMVTRQIMAVGPSPTMSAGGISGWGAQSSTTPGEPLRPRAPYDLFWDRVDALLHEKPWISCADRKKALPRKERAGLDVLCSVTTDDKLPG